MASENISNVSTDEMCCDICYDNECDNNLFIFLKCCKNSKKICIRCVNCLKTPICPYCRKSLDSSCVPFMNEDAFMLSSAPTTRASSFLSWENFLSQENIIDPSLYDDSRRMRRTMRRLRYQYRQMNAGTSLNTYSLTRAQRRNHHKQRRENNRNISRQVMNFHNQSIYLDEIFFMDF